MEALSYAEICALLEEAKEVMGLPFPDVYLMAEIAIAESGGIPLAHNRNSNGTIDRGLFQINSIHEKEAHGLEGLDWKAACYSVRTNIVLAVGIWRKQSYAAWSSYVRCP